MGVALNFLFKLLSWLGTVLIMRQGAKAEERADSAEKTLDTIVEVNRPAEPAELDSVRDKYRRD